MCSKRGLRALGHRIPFVLSLVLVSLLAAGCDGLFQPFESQDRRRVDPGGPEVLRIFAPTEVIPQLDLAMIEVERVAHEDDRAAYDETRVRCLVLTMTGAGYFLVEQDIGLDAPLSRIVRTDIDRGTSLGLLVTSDEPGTGVIRARLLSRTCDGAEGAPVIADTLRTVRFAVTESTPDEDAGSSPVEDAGP